MIKGIHHISMKCGNAEDLRKVKEFYVSLLGLKSERYLKKNKFFIPLSLKVQKFMDKDRFIALAKAVLT